MTSGARKKGVPITVLRFRVRSLRVPETPKSASLHSPFPVTRMFPIIHCYFLATVEYIQGEWRRGERTKERESGEETWLNVSMNFVGSVQIRESLQC